MSLDKACARVCTLSKGDSQESGPNLSIDKPKINLPKKS